MRNVPVTAVAIAPPRSQSESALNRQRFIFPIDYGQASKLVPISDTRMSLMASRAFPRLFPVRVVEREPSATRPQSRSSGLSHPQSLPEVVVAFVDEVMRIGSKGNRTALARWLP